MEEFAVGLDGNDHSRHGVGLLTGLEGVRILTRQYKHSQSVLIPGADEARLAQLYVVAAMLFVCPAAAMIAVYLLFPR
jgi:hypothetical protein